MENAEIKLSICDEIKYLGMKKCQIAKDLGISRSTLYVYFDIYDGKTTGIIPTEIKKWFNYIHEHYTMILQEEHKTNADVKEELEYKKTKKVNETFDKIGKKVIEIRWRGHLFDDPTLIICNKEDLKEALRSVTSGSYDNIKIIIIKDSIDDKNKTFDEVYEESVGAVQLGHKFEGEKVNEATGA